MLQFDAAKWRALGLDAELTALLVACVNAANRAPKPGAAGRGIQSMTVDTDGGLRVVMTDRSEIALGGLRVQLSDVDTAAIIASATGEVLDALPVTVVDLDIEGGRLIKVMSDGSRAPGPLLPVGPMDPDPEAAPALSGGALDLVDGDLVLVPPTVTAGQPNPQLVLTSLTRDGADVLDEVEDGRIADAAPGVYEAVWTASNGVDPDATAVASLTIAVIPPGSITVESDGTISITLPDSATAPFDVRIAGEVVTIDPAAYTPTSAPVALGQPDIAGTGGDGEVLTVQSRGLFAGHADAGKIAIVGGWYRNDTAVGDTDGSYTQDDAVDGDRTLTWRDVATNAAGSTVAVSSGVLCPAAPAAGWWHPQALVHVDYASDRARINGTTFASIAAAKAANAIKTAGGVDYIDVAGLGASYALSASGIVPNDTATRNMASLDDGTSNNVVAIGQTYSSSTHRSMFWVITAGTGVYTPPTTTTLTHGMALNLSLRVKSAALRRGMNGTGTTSGTAITLPAVNRLVLGNRSAGDRAWTGTLYHVLLINADLADAAVDALPGVA
ncbi:hypothetical protein PARHAE_02427 [Paracoccus haematequi]|uniref:Uncharacterized protein n=1 Tax=Paracoccus haematequi TaxID=2491866 RepID=A0A3S5D442_9RHOB|nr:hypothetical protein [Paracoccus haematequi]VDS09235.1 hypothetical protein PARHAE_02427 [Paracoccus haematequi]